MDFADPGNTAREGLIRYKEFLASIGMPRNFKDIGAKEEDIESMAHTACYGDGRDGTIGSFVPLGKNDVITIYRMML